MRLLEGRPEGLGSGVQMPAVWGSDGTQDDLCNSQFLPVFFTIVGTSNHKAQEIKSHILLSQIMCFATRSGGLNSTIRYRARVCTFLMSPITAVTSRTGALLLCALLLWPLGAPSLNL